jgi:hypothetical protein
MLFDSPLPSSPTFNENDRRRMAIAFSGGPFGGGWSKNE